MNRNEKNSSSRGRERAKAKAKATAMRTISKVIVKLFLFYCVLSIVCQMQRGTRDGRATKQPFAPKWIFSNDNNKQLKGPLECNAYAFIKWQTRSYRSCAHRADCKSNRRPITATVVAFEWTSIGARLSFPLILRIFHRKMPAATAASAAVGYIFSIDFVYLLWRSPVPIVLMQKYCLISCLLFAREKNAQRFSKQYQLAVGLIACWFSAFEPPHTHFTRRSFAFSVHFYYDCVYVNCAEASSTQHMVQVKLWLPSTNVPTQPAMLNVTFA